MPALLSAQQLEDDWYADQQSVTLPYVAQDGPVLLERDFFLKEVPNDTLVLDLYGLGGCCEIYLNGTLLYKACHLPRRIQLQLLPTVLSWQWNKLEIQLQPYVEDNGLQPVLYNTVTLTLLDSLPPLLTEAPRPALRADSTVEIAPVGPDGSYPTRDYLHEQLATARRYGRVLYFSWQPPEWALAEAAHLGWQISARPGHHRLRWRHWLEQPPPQEQWWYNSAGEQQPGYGTWEEPMQPQRYALPGKASLLIVALLPLLLLVLWKLLRPRDYKALMQLGNLRARLLELSREGSFTSQNTNLLVPQLVRMALAAALLTWGIYLLHHQGLLPGHRSAQLATMLISLHPLLLYMLLLAVLLALGGLKLLLFRSIEQVYNMRELAFRTGSLEVLSAFPSLAVVPFMALLWLLAPMGWQPVLAWLLLLLLLVHLVRRLLLLVQGLRQSLRLNLLLIFLYICTLEIIPWLFVL